MKSIEAGLGIPESTPEAFAEFAEATPPDFDVRAEVPSSWSLRTNMSAVKDQGLPSTCGAFGVNAILEFEHGKRSLSECQLLKECSDQSTAGLMQFALQKGVVEDRWWHYDPSANQPCRARGESGHPRYSFKELFFIHQTRSSDLVDRPEHAAGRDGLSRLSDTIRLYIGKSRLPVCVEVPVFRSSDGWKGWGWDYQDADVRIPLGADPGQALAWANRADKWHLCAICGYDDAAKRFDFKNSWGPSFGEERKYNGFGTMTYAYINRLCRLAMSGR